MEAILPYNTQNRENFINSAIEIGFDEFTARKFVYTMQDSDLDIFELMAKERMDLILYGWKICQTYMDVHVRDPENLAGNLKIVLQRLLYCSLDIWFSREWDSFPVKKQAALIYCLKSAKPFYERLPTFNLINWNYFISLDINPWFLFYLNYMFALEGNSLNSNESYERVEKAVTSNDCLYIQVEGLFVILLRLIKLFDSRAMHCVKSISMRTIAAWNFLYETAKRESSDYPHVIKEHKHCIVLICHIYLMAVYETDDISGFVIDNMMNNIRFYYQSTSETTVQLECTYEEFKFTPARYIAMTCANLRMSTNDFFEMFVSDTYDECFTSLFGVISQAYKSYLLGNLLMVINSMNEEDFEMNLVAFKRYLNMYVTERERSETFMLNELRRQDMQRTAHNCPITAGIITNFRAHICKGNRMSNIVNYKNCNDAQIAEELGITREPDDSTDDAVHEKSDVSIDPIFQNIRNTTTLLNYAYEVLAKRIYKGWHFAKVILLVKIIGHELNIIETWRYHNGLTTDFMLNLESKLARHFEDLAVIFSEYHFMEREFWLTAFYLDPNFKNYEAVLRCGLRFNRRRHADGNDENDKHDKLPAEGATGKFGLLSSTIDVEEIVALSNHEEPGIDYDPLYKALRSFQLPQSIIKDLLTVTFTPRNKGFSWAINWIELRKRCKILLKVSEHKRRLVALNMAEANDHLKYLNIDYEKYKNRPQLDYGSIEEGYEGVGMFTYDDGSDYEDDINDDEVDFDDIWDSKLDEEKRELEAKRKRLKKEQKDEFEMSQAFFVDARRTRSRTAAVLATAKLTRQRNGSSSDDENNKTAEMSPINSTPTPTLEATTSLLLEKPTSMPTPATTVDPTKCNLSELLVDSSHSVTNDTSGFKSYADIWYATDADVKHIKDNRAHLKESDHLLQKLTVLKSTQLTHKTTPSSPQPVSNEAQKSAEACRSKEVSPSTIQREAHTASSLFRAMRKCEARKQDQVNLLGFVSKYMPTDNTNNSDEEFMDETLSDEREEDEAEENFAPQASLEEEKMLNADMKFIEATKKKKMIDYRKDESVKAMDIDAHDLQPSVSEMRGAAQVQLKESGDVNVKTAISRQQSHVAVDLMAKPAKRESSEIEENEEDGESKMESYNQELTETDNDSTEVQGGCTPSDESSQSSCDLKKECSTRQLKVKLHHLTVADVRNLRQPYVLLERMDMAKYLDGQTKAKRMRMMVEEDLIEETDASTDSGSNYSPYTLHGPHVNRPHDTRGTLKRKNRNAVSNERVASERRGSERKGGERRFSERSCGSRSSVRTRGGGEELNLVVTPRSASGLKFRISTSGRQVDESECVQISSSSDSYDSDSHKYRHRNSAKQKEPQNNNKKFEYMNMSITIAAKNCNEV